MKSWLADEFVTTDQITSRHSLRLAAPAHTGSGPAISDGEAELLGWVMGDGSVQAYATRAGAGDELGELIRGLGARYPGASFRAIARMAGCTHQTAAAYLRGSGMPGGHVRTGSGSMVRISLSQAKPDGVTAIDALLAREDVQASRHARLPQGIAGLELVTWRLRASYSAELLKRSGYNHKDPVLFVLSLSPSQREAFLRGVFGAEGCLDRGHRVYTQADGPQQDSIAVALYLSGKRPAMRHWSDSSRRSLGKTCSPGANIGETSPFIGGGAIRREACDPAPVWCVSTELGSWTARQSGQVFLTGNSQYGDPLGAAAHESAYHWYDQGGWLPPGRSLAINNTGRPERVLGPREGTVIHVRVDPVIAAVTPDRRLGQRIAQHILMATKGGQRLFPAGVTPR
jgi:hypothetical protein